MKASQKMLAGVALLVAATAAAAQDLPKAGDIVYAQWRKNDWYRGKVNRKYDDGFHIVFDDGDKGVVPAARIALDKEPEKKQLKLGTHILAKWKRDSRFYPGKIDQISTDGRYRIKFDDGDVGHAKIEQIRLIAR